MKRPEGILDLISTEKPTIYCQNNANIQLHVRSTKTELYFSDVMHFPGNFHLSEPIKLHTRHF